MPTLKIVRFETAWLNDTQKLFGLLDDLDIEYEKSSIEARVGTWEHTKEHHKLNAGLPPAQTQEMASRFQEFLASRG